MQKDNTMNANGPRYASLTAGLLARKGEAVPAAAAFTAEAIAQHIPARRLAQEAERELIDRHPVVEDSVGYQVVGHESSGAAVFDRQHDLIEQAFDESAPVGEPDEPNVEASPSVESLLDPAAVNPAADEPSAMAPVAREEFTLHEKPVLDLRVPEPQPVHALSGLEAFMDRSDIADTTEAPESSIPRDAQDVASLTDLNHSQESWFEDIVSSAISEAEGQRLEQESAASKPLAASLSEPDEAPSLSDAEVDNSRSETEDLAPVPSATSVLPMASAPVASATRTALLTGTVPTNMIAPLKPEPKRENTGGCGDKAAKVRDAIKSGNSAAAAKSAMRLDPRRFIRLSLAAQKLQLTNQDIMIAALDTYLDALDEDVFSDCSCMKKGLI